MALKKQEDKRVRGWTMICASLAFWVLFYIVFDRIEFRILSMGWAGVAAGVLFLVAWGLFILGFHRVVIERGYFGEVGLLGVLGPPSLLLLFFLPRRGSKRRR